MKLLLAVFLSLAFFGCAEADPDDDKNVVDGGGNTPEALAEKAAKERESNEVFTITHRAGDVEDVLISYENPVINGVTASNFKMLPGQCFEFTITQFSFIKNIKLGLGGISIGNLGHSYKVVCGSPLDGDGELGHKHEAVKRGEKIPPCAVLAGKNYNIMDEGKYGFDKYVLREAGGRNPAENCKNFEEFVVKVAKSNGDAEEKGTEGTGGDAE